MENLVVTLIDPNLINYQSLLLCIGLYLLFMWGIFAVWVFIDAYKRYGKGWIAILFALLVLPFNVPGFILYLISRPESKYIEDSNHNGVDGALNVPVVHYTGEDGKIALSINLQLSPSLINKPDVSLNVDWDPANQNIKFKEQLANNTLMSNSSVKIQEQKDKAINFMKNITGKISNSIKSDVSEKSTKKESKEN